MQYGRSGTVLANGITVGKDIIVGAGSFVRKSISEKGIYSGSPAVLKIKTKAKSARVRLTIIATGSEVPLAVEVSKILGPDVQVVSMPSVEHFRVQGALYKQQILRGSIIAIEASSPSPWFEFADAVIGIDRFGMSGAGDAVYSAFGFDVRQIVREIKDKIKK